jgi:phospholipase C
MLLSDRLPQRAAVDHTQYDTTSILATIEDRFGLRALSSRDAAVNSLALAMRRGQHRH